MKYCTGGQWWVWLPLICRDGVTVLPIPPMFQYRSSLLLAFPQLYLWNTKMDTINGSVFNPLVGFEPSGSVCYISAVTLSDSQWRIHILDQQLGNSVNYSETQPRRWITCEPLWCNIMYRRPVQCHTLVTSPVSRRKGNAPKKKRICVLRKKFSWFSILSSVSSTISICSALRLQSKILTQTIHETTAKPK